MTIFAFILLLLSTIEILLYFFGILPSSSLLGIMLDPVNFFSFSSVTGLINILVIAGGIGGAIIGLFYKNYDIIIKAAIVPFLILWLKDIINIYNVLQTATNSTFATVIISPLLVMTIWLVVEWFGGKV